MEILTVLIYVIMGVLAVCAISAFAVLVLGLVPVTITISIVGLIVFTIQLSSSSA